MLITGGCSGIGKMHFIRLMQGIFPHSWFNFLFGNLCGLYTVMDHFTGRK